MLGSMSTVSSPSRISHFLAPVLLVTILAAVAAVIATSGQVAAVHGRSEVAQHPTLPKLPPYWTVRPGDTFSEISQKTGLTLAQLEAFNPDADPEALDPGQRLNLWAHPPVPRPKPPGPRFWTVRPGESFGSIAAATGIDLALLEQLNPRLKPATLQPGTRVRLRR
jgi:LysM repeat protein